MSEMLLNKRVRDIIMRAILCEKKLEIVEEGSDPGMIESGAITVPNMIV